MIGVRSCRKAFLCAALLMPVLPQSAVAQSVRITGSTRSQFVNMRPFVADSVPVLGIAGDGTLRTTEDGQVVRCLAGDDFCRFNRSVDAISTIPMFQDLHISSWGYGQGVRIYAHLRGRSVVAEQQTIWPRADDSFDALVAYVELDRTRMRLRGGRQWKVSGLGYYNYDGASALVRLWPGISVEAYGGWSLTRGLNEPRTSDALSAIEALAPNERGLLIGAQARMRHSAGSALSVLYQREIRSDRAALFSERFALDGLIRQERATLEASLEIDLASRKVNEARFTGRMRVNESIDASAFALRYRPFFELWTIWGAFDPVGFQEFGLSSSWRDRERPRNVTVQVARREYGETGVTDLFGPVRSTGWRVTAAGSMRPADAWTLQGQYGAEIGFGAAKSQGRVSVRREFDEAVWIGVSGTAFQRIFEFRVAKGTVFGLGANGGLRLGARSRLSGSVDVYRHRAGVVSPEVDWNQVRASLQFDWTIGSEPTVRGSR